MDRTLKGSIFRREVLRAVLAAGALLHSLGVAAQGSPWPEKTITVIVPYAPGGGTDVVARLIATELSGVLNRSVVVDNKPGARGSVAYQAMLKNAGDGGHTFVIDNSSFALQPLYKGLPYDADTALSPVVRLAVSPTVLLVGGSVPVKSFKEFVEYAKANQGRTAFASYGAGSTSHLSGELLSTLTNANMLHVPYKGSGPALTDLLGGQVHAMFGDPLSAKPFVESGKLKAVAISGFDRWKAYPDTPTYRELGLEPMSSPGWFGVIAASKSPKGAVDKMAETIKLVLGRANVRSKIQELGAEVSPLGPTEFAQALKADTKRWSDIVRARNIEMN